MDPAFRRRGVGSALLARALELLAAQGEKSALLVTPRAADVGRCFAQAKGATFHHAEHHMELDGPPVGPPAARASTAALMVRPATDLDRPEVVRILEEAFGAGTYSAAAGDSHDLALVVERDGVLVGSLRLSLEGASAGIYGFAVREDLRGQGIGRAALYQVCLEARRREAGTVTLEVEVDNDHALGLYTSVGFERRTTEDYFRVTA